jgi:hypothetical protein
MRPAAAGEDAAARSVPAAARGVRGRGERAPEGPVYLRSSEHKLPDLLASLNGQIDVALQGKVDSAHNHALRNTFEVVPDAPVSRFVLSMQGGHKGLLVNSENLCSPNAKVHALADFTAQNGKLSDTTPTVQNSCKSAKHKKGHKRGGNHHR